MKPNYQHTLTLLCVLFSSMLSAQSDLYISAVMDGGLTGGLPKAVKLCANADIPDLSIYGIASANNGLGSTGQEYALLGSMEAGECIWLASESAGFASYFGCPPDYTDDALNINGDDAIELYLSGVVVDLFGNPDMDGTNQCWEYLDGYAVRNNTIPNGGNFDNTCANAEWTYSGIDALDGILTYLDILPSEPFGPFETNCVETTYYSNIDTLTLSCAPLKSALSTLISNQNNIPYGPDAFYSVIDFVCDYDYQNGVVLDRYGSTNYTDCSGDRYTATAAPTGEGEGWNREHIFPRSWWGGSSTASQFTDLHNIFPSDAFVNAEKANFTLGKAALGQTSQSQIGDNIFSCAEGCTDQVFEPADQYKGDFARAYLYMAIRYENEMAAWEDATCAGDAVLTGDSYMVYEECLLARLLQWHQYDAVDDLERARNEAIFETQGNRNPMIDHPSWSGLIWGVSNGSSITSVDCIADGCAPLNWELIEVTTNSSFNNAGAWTQSGSSYSANGYCGPDCVEPVESWLVYGPLDMSNTSSMFLDFTASELFGETHLDFLWTNAYSGCPADLDNNWLLASSLYETDLPTEGTFYNQSIDYSSATGSSVYIAIRYADDGSNGYSSWILSQFAIDADVCPEEGEPIASSCSDCPEDINEDGLIDTADFIELNSAFGQSCDCPADINGDGEVNVSDFVQLNSVFGESCY